MQKKFKNFRKRVNSTKFGCVFYFQVLVNYPAQKLKSSHITIRLALSSFKKLSDLIAEYKTLKLILTKTIFA